jgi:hypothetical protein
MHGLIEAMEKIRETIPATLAIVGSGPELDALRADAKRKLVKSRNGQGFVRNLSNTLEKICLTMPEQSIPQGYKSQNSIVRIFPSLQKIAYFAKEILNMHGHILAEFL